MEILEISRRKDPVVVIGGGASGVLSAIALLRSATRPVVLMERDATWSTGPAYATTDPGHLLNVPAAKLSADPARPDDFLDWARARSPRATPDCFLPRAWFGEYLRDSLDTAARESRVSLTRVTAEAVAVGGCTQDRDAQRVRVTVRHRRSIIAAHVVLALGNPPSRALQCRTGTVINDPWSVCGSDLVGPDDSVAIIGSGLTAIDVALSLAGRGHRGAIRIVSRRGLLPRRHEPHGAPLLAAGHESLRTARDALVWFRGAIADAGGDWRSAFDAIRPCANEIWRGLPPAERARLLRHTTRYWEVHRHRLAPRVADAFDDLVRSGRVELALGDAGCGESMAALGATWIINCTGPNFDLHAWNDPLVGDVLASGLGRPGSLGLGFDVTPDGALIDRAGGASAAISVAGPLRRGADWETTAIPEIRAQADALARRVQVAKSGCGPRGTSARPFGSSQSSWRPSAVISRK